MNHKTLALTIIFSLVAFAQRGQEYDLLIENGRIVDGAGNPWYSGNVAIKGDRIAAVGRTGSRAKARIDARGMMVSPGFIDMHSHSDFSLLVDGNAESKVRQGVTSEILGEDTSAAPLLGPAIKEFQNYYKQYKIDFDWSDFQGYFDRLMRRGISVNIGSYVGSGQLRLCVMGVENRKPTKQELERMKSLLDAAMRQGALGLSSGLIYPPSSYADAEELVELARIAARYGGIYVSHIRSESNKLLEALNEAFEIGRRAGLPVEVHHFKSAGQQNWGRMKDAVRAVEEARARGLDVTANQYPYIAGMTGLSAVIPTWAHAGGTDELVKRLSDPSTRARIRKEIEVESADWENLGRAAGGWENVLIASVTGDKNKIYEGKNVAEAARMRGADPLEFIFDLLIEEKGVVGAIYFLMSEDDVAYAMRQPWVSIGSDGEAVKPEGVLGQGKPHPRFYGTFPRVLAKYVRQEKVLRLEEAIRKMTSLPAQRLGLTERGLLRPGMYADIVIFDPEAVADRATFSDPHNYPVGIEYVLVNGQLVIERGRHTGARPGRILYGPGKEGARS